MSAPALLPELALRMARGAVRVVDLTQTLSPSFPALQLPPQFGQVQAFKIERISHYDEAGPGWYWNNFSCGEHTGTHFDAPVHWISGRDHPANSVDTIAPEHFIAPAVVLDASAEVAQNDDWLLTVEFIQDWERRHGRIPPRAWVLLRSDWSRRAQDPAAFLNLREDGAHARPDAGSRAMADPRARRARLRSGDHQHRCRPVPCLAAALSLPHADAWRQPLRPAMPEEPGSAAAAGRHDPGRAAEDRGRLRQPLRVLALVEQA